MNTLINIFFVLLFSFYIKSIANENNENAKTSITANIEVIYQNGEKKNFVFFHDAKTKYYFIDPKLKDINCFGEFSIDQEQKSFMITCSHVKNKLNLSSFSTIVMCGRDPVLFKASNEKNKSRNQTLLQLSCK